MTLRALFLRKLCGEIKEKDNVEERRRKQFDRFVSGVASGEIRLPKPYEELSEEEHKELYGVSRRDY